MSKTVALFDYDGTLSSGEAGFLFAKHLLGTPHFLYFTTTRFFAFIFYALHFYDEKMLAVILAYLFKGKDVTPVKAIAEYYAKVEMPKRLYPEVIDRMAWHLKLGHRVIITSRSLGVYLRPWAKNYGITEVLATELEELDGIYTGKIKGCSCYGEKKVQRITQLLGKLEDYTLYAYGDSQSDFPMLQIANQPFIIKKGKIEDYIQSP